MKTIKQTYIVTPKTINEICSNVKEFLEKHDTGREICLRIGLCVEEALLALCEEYEEAPTVEVLYFKKLGKPLVSLRYRGKQFNPMEREQKDELSELILNGLGIAPVWSSRFGMNRISFRAPATGIRTELLLVMAILLSALLGACGGMIPEGIRTTLTHYLLSPISDVFLKVLYTLAPMLIFLSVITSIIKNGSGTDFGKIGKYIISRYIIVTIISGVIFSLALIMFYDFRYGNASVSSSFEELLNMLLDIVPSNIILPFAENNMMQIVILAMLFGVIILGLDNRVDGLRSTLFDLHSVFQSGMELICNVLPLFIFTSLLSVLWENGIGNFAKLWKPVVAGALVEHVYVLIAAAYTAMRLKTSMFSLIKKILPSYLVGLTTASSILAFTKGNEINKKKLGIAEEYSDLAYPLGISLYVATFTPIFIASTYYLAELFSVEVSPGWFITAGLLCLILAYATPQVSGGSLICIGVMMNQLGIPSEGLSIAGTLVLLLDFFSTGAKVAGQHMEMLLQAHHLKMIDYDVLKS